MPGSVFVVALRDISLSDGGMVHKDEVGVMKPASESVFFVRPWQDVRLSPNDYQVFDVAQTGDAYTRKICNICHRLLPTTEFERNQNNINRPVRRPSCRTCRKTLVGLTPTPKEKRQWLTAKPHLEPFQCPICCKRTIAGVTSIVDLDHNHRTGEIRGWICDSCNTGIGRFKDDVQILKRAIEYVE